jgi:flavin reductase (DIM6/NTAB) family NADH-FMN oxidoreductase RutF
LADPTPFEAIKDRLDYPMYVVTAAADGDVGGCLVAFATQCSIQPAHFLACLSKTNRTTALAAQADTLVVHVLHERDHPVATRFGAYTGDEVDKLAGCDWSAGPGGAPVLAELDWFAGRVLARHDVGDHVAYVLDVHPLGAADRAHEPQLGFQAVRTMTPGHEP